MSNTGSKTDGWVKIFFQKLARRMVLCMPLFMRDGLWVLFNSHNAVERCLRQLKEKGFDPKTIVDCGAFVGNWTRQIKTIFPDAKVLMIEPQADKEPLLVQVCNAFPGSVDYIRCLMGPEPKAAVNFFEIEGGGSSVLRDLTHSPFKTATYQMRTLDEVLREKKLTGATFLKLDVQGYELEVLKGGQAAMKNAEVILLEVSFVDFNESGPLFHEVVAFMKEHGFLVYDLFALPRSADNTLFQADVFFMKENSKFRQIKFAGEG